MCYHLGPDTNFKDNAMNQDTQIVKYEYHDRMPVKTPANLKLMLMHFREQVEAMLPTHSQVNFRALVESGMQAAMENSRLLSCTQQSVLRAIKLAARFGLDCSGKLRSSHLVPYGKTCKLIIGYGGLLDLARRAAATVNIDVQLVYNGDKFDITHGTQPHVDHEPEPTSDRLPKDIIGAYAVATFKEHGRQQIEYMTVQEIQRIRATSKAANDGPWVTHFGEMCRKTVIRRIVKYLPVSVVEAGRLLAEAVAHDVETSGFDRNQIGPDDATRTKTIRARLQEPPSAPNADAGAPVEYAPDGEPIPDHVGRESDEALPEEP